MKITSNFKKLVVFAFALLLSFAFVTPANAAVTETGIIYDGNGSCTKTLANGKVAKVDIVNSVATITVDGEKFAWYSNVTTATAVIADDDLLHLFFHTGDYFVYDLYENAAYIVAYKSSSSQAYCKMEESGAYAVFGTSVPNSSFHSCICDSKYFFQYGKAGKKRLMTREEFERIAYDKESPATQAPATQAPATQAPATQAPATQSPATQAPATQSPATQSPATQAPDITINTNLDFEFWWKQYTEGVITWEQLTQVLYKWNWTSTSKKTGSKVTYYFYDDKGNLIRTEEFDTEEKVDNGTGELQGTVTNQGAATITLKNEGQGGGSIHGTTTVVLGDDLKQALATKANSGNKCCSTSKSAASSKISYHVKRKGKKVKLTRTIGKKTGTICTVYFNRKKGIARFDGIIYKNIKYVGYTSKSRQILLQTKGNKILIVARGKKAVVGKSYKAKTLNGAWNHIEENPAGLINRVANSQKALVKGVKNAQPKLVK